MRIVRRKKEKLKQSKKKEEVVVDPGERERETGMCWLPFLLLGLFLPLCLLTSLLAQGAHYSSLLDQNPPPWKWRHFNS